MIEFHQILLFSVGICFYGSYSCGAGETKHCNSLEGREATTISHGPIPEPTDGEKGEISTILLVSEQ